MALKKSELYSTLWSSCDELRGGMDASQYKDYVLVLLFIKYISDKYAGVPYAPSPSPKGPASGTWSRSKASPTSGTRSTKRSSPRSPTPTNSSPSSRTRTSTSRKTARKATTSSVTPMNTSCAATESGKSKGQFYTPAEVSRIMAQILGIAQAHTTSSTTVFDPTCGSLLL